MRLYRTTKGLVAELDEKFYFSELASLDQLIAGDDLEQQLQKAIAQWLPADREAVNDLRAPIGTQEVWAAGVTYFRSRTARMEESQAAGGGDFYHKVYHAERPELFFKATASRVIGPGGKVAIRSDSKWSVPEPELALVINPGGAIVGYTIGNDMSARDIEGENPLYLPQAKIYDGSCALGPAILVSSTPLAKTTEIRLKILRNEEVAFSAATTLEAMKRDWESLTKYLYHSTSFPNGCILLTGTGIVPPDEFTLSHGDEIRITIDGIGTLTNVVG